MPAPPALQLDRTGQVTEIEFSVIVLAMTNRFPLLKIPAPTPPLLNATAPWRMVSPERVTLPPEILNTLLMPRPSIIVVLAPAPITFKLKVTVRFSVYVAEATMIESPEAASEMACPMVLQALWVVSQLLLSSPFTPSTYQVVLARTLGTTRRNRAIGRRFVQIRLMMFLLLGTLATAVRMSKIR